MLPRSLHFELPANAFDDVRYHGGFADVLRCECGGQEVAVKALRLQGHNLQEMRRVSQSLLASLPVRVCELGIFCRIFVEKLSLGNPSNIRTCCHWLG